MPFSEVVEDSVSREYSSSDWKHEDLLLEAFLVTFIFYTPIEVPIALYFCLRYGMYKFLSYHINV